MEQYYYIIKRDSNVTCVDFIARSESLLSIATEIGTPLLKSSRNSSRISKIPLMLNKPSPAEMNKNGVEVAFIRLSTNLMCTNK